MDIKAKYKWVNDIALTVDDINAIKILLNRFKEQDHTEILKRINDEPHDVYIVPRDLLQINEIYNENTFFIKHNA
ncbi:hypothetical protein [Mycoplasmopsis edwardii]|uniref:hypothetical protein n=1 Tax=Mycoplasmopsis edwardii TaxID=53558 RepID=UPI000E3CD41C|nr:hypothetical protein [Mycoplasmopsis edwardii]